MPPATAPINPATAAVAKSLPTDICFFFVACCLESYASPPDFVAVMAAEIFPRHTVQLEATFQHTSFLGFTVSVPAFQNYVVVIAICRWTKQSFAVKTKI